MENAGLSVHCGKLKLRRFLWETGRSVQKLKSGDRCLSGLEKMPEPFPIVNHSENTKRLAIDAFPHPMREDVLKALEQLMPGSEPSMAGSGYFRFDRGDLHVPSRVYFGEADLSDPEGLNEIQQGIFAALMTRHHSGYQRERWAKVLCRHPSEWAAPFIAMLLEDYVPQISRVLEGGLGEEWDVLMKRFAFLNAERKMPLTSRIFSYHHYQHAARLGPENSPAYRLALRFDLWDRKTAPRFLRRIG